MSRPTPVILTAVLAVIVAALFAPTVTWVPARRQALHGLHFGSVVVVPRCPAMPQVRASLIEAIKARRTTATLTWVRRRLRYVLYENHHPPSAPRA